MTDNGTKRHGRVGIQIENFGKAIVTNPYISGTDVGLKVINSSIDVKNATFDKVRVPVLAENSDGKIVKSRITNDVVKTSKSRSSKGWTAELSNNGPPLPVMCPSCKAIFASNKYFFPRGSLWSLWDMEEVCTECGFEHAKVSDGIFNLAKDTIEILNAPDITYAMLSSLNTTLNNIKHDDIDKLILNNNSEIDNILKSILSLVVNNGPGAITIILSIMSVLLAIESNKISKLALSVSEKQLYLQEKDKSEDILSKILEKIGQHSASKPTNEQNNRAASESVTGKLSAKKKPKWRCVKKRELAARRVAFKGSPNN